jgi:stearoyl-CoA desaturase (delta-9 desaturase)
MDHVLSEPSYGYEKNGQLVVPTNGQLFDELISRLNVFRSRKNWLPFLGWTATLLLSVPLYCFARYHFSWGLLVLGFLYSMVGLGSFGTFWFHRYATHRAFRFRNDPVRAICRNLFVKIVPDEIYVVSHHVHHRLSDKPGDPYNASAGFLYCFLADANHQMINPDLTEGEYEQLCNIMRHTGVRLNSYPQYKHWGTLCHPFWTTLHYALSWAGWYGIFFLVGGHALATALFGGACVWAFGIRTFNFAGHGSGKDLRRKGIDFSADDRSINQVWPGYVAGEWHSNHHLYPSSARSGFLAYQLDLPYIAIRLLSAVGAVTSVRDSRAEFMRAYYEPYLRSLQGTALGDVPHNAE